MAVDATTAATAGLWVDQSAAAVTALKGSGASAASTAWSGFTAWYSADQVTDLAAELSGLSVAGQEAIVGMFSQYVAELVALLSGTRVIVPNVRLRPIRNDADPIVVASRPASVFRETFSLLGDEIAAQRRAELRARQLMETDLMLAARQAQMDTMRELKVTRYRRVLRPELSETGPCGLCVVAADRIYKIEELLPLHGGCNCITMGILEGQDVGARLNREDLEAIYAAAGSTKAADLKRTRLQVREHGELGPVLTTRGQNFKGPDDLGGPVEPNQRLLEERLGKLRDVLAQLDTRDGDGEDVDDQRDYQRGAIARTEKTLQGAGGGSDDEPPRRGMLGQDGPDEFPEFDGWKPPAKRSQIDTFDELDAEILLDGDGTPGGHGYHRHGLGVKASEFPQGWGETEVLQWIRDIIDFPTHGFPEGSRTFSLFGESQGVQGIVVVVLDHGSGTWRIATGFPLPAVDWPR